VKPKSMIAPMVILSLAVGAQGRVRAAGDQTAKPPKQGNYSLTQLDAGTDLAPTVVQHMSDNGVVAGDALSPVDKSFAWSAQTGLVLLTLGGSHSVETAVSSNGIVTGASGTTGDAAVRGFVWTVAGGIAEIGNLGGEFTVPQSVNSSGVVVGDSMTSDGRAHAFVWTASGGMLDLDPAGTDSSARWVTENGLVIGSIATETGHSVFA
jgi:probable HAF family extracellular repeat protein